MKFFSPNFIQFEVHCENNDYHVDITNDVAWCDCMDFQSRWNKKPGSFACKHIYSCYFFLTQYIKTNYY